MSEQWLEHKPNCEIEFRVYDMERYKIFLRFFDALRKWTQSLQPASIHGSATTSNHAAQQTLSDDDTNPSRSPVSSQEETVETLAVHQEETVNRKQFSRPEDWMLALRPQDLKFLDMPAHPEAIKALREWHGLSRRERRRLIKKQENKTQLQILADFADMIRYWQDVEFQLISCELDGDKASLEYSTFDFPFNGKAAIEELLMFFGFFSIINDTC